MTPLNEQQRQEIEKEIFAGRKISAIKLHREATGSGLAESKNAVEDMEVDLRRQFPERFVGGGQAKSGCFGVLVCLTAIAVLVEIVRFAAHK
jgi:hypothetical protein